MDYDTLSPPELVRLYTGARDARDAKKKAFDVAVAPIDEVLDQVAIKLQAYMNINGLKSVPTEFGTAIQTTKSKATVEDWDALYAFILYTGRIDFLQKRVASSALAEYAEEAPNPPPGVSFFVERQVQVRRPKS